MEDRAGLARVLLNRQKGSQAHCLVSQRAANHQAVVPSLLMVHLLQMPAKKVNTTMILNLAPPIGLEPPASKLEAQKLSVLDSTKLPLQPRFNEPFSRHQFGVVAFKTQKW